MLSLCVLLAAVTASAGAPVVLQEKDLLWDAQTGCYTASVTFAESPLPYAGFVYFNRDNGHSPIDVAAFPGLSAITYDAAMRQKGFGLDIPELGLDCPVFGNASRAFLDERLGRSIPRAMMTRTAPRAMRRAMRFYLDGQFWVFPAHKDHAPSGTRGDLFASLAPYFLVTEGSSWSDQPYVRLALETAAALSVETRRAACRRGLLVPTVMTLLRKALPGVVNESAYLSPQAHPTAWPSAAGIDRKRLFAAAAALTPEKLMPMAIVDVRPAPTLDKPARDERTYATPFAHAYVLRAYDPERTFTITAQGAREFAFVATHDPGHAATVRQAGLSTAVVTLSRERMRNLRRVDIAVFGRNPGTDWGAPSYVSFAVIDPRDAYCDPVLYP